MKVQTESVVGLIVVITFGTLAWVYLYGPRADGASFGSPGLAWAALKAWATEMPERYRDSRADAVREREIGVEVSVSPGVVLDRTVEAMTRSGYTLEGRSQNTLTFARREEPSVAIGCILLLFFILPAILYFLFAAKTLKSTMAAFPDGEGGSRIVIGGNDPQALRQLTDWAHSLRSQAPAETESGPTTYDDDDDDNPLEQIRRLAKLRDDGLVTPEEFETKKRDLLDRM